jgi:hypothetical protein
MTPGQSDAHGTPFAQALLNEPRDAFGPRVVWGLEQKGEISHRPTLSRHALSVMTVVFRAVIDRAAARKDRLHPLPGRPANECSVIGPSRA